MKRQFVIATVMVAIMALSVLMVPPVMSGLGDEKMKDGQTSAITEAMVVASQKYVRSMFEYGSPSVEELSYDNQVKGTQMPPAIRSCVYCDITGDSINDVLVHVFTVDPVTGMPTRTDIKAVNGSNGKTLWNKRFENCVALTLPAGDLNGDNKTDVVINVLACIDLISMRGSGKVIGVNGCNGAELWSKHKTGGRNEGVMMISIPANLTSADRTDIVISTITMTLSGSRTNIMAINGSDGSELWEKYSGSMVVGFPVDLTNDGKDEVVIGMPQEIGIPMATEGISATTPNVIAVNGTDGIEIWSNGYPEVATFSPAGDLTSDGANDLTVWIGCCRLDALRGYDGTQLWSIGI